MRTVAQMLVVGILFVGAVLSHKPQAQAESIVVIREPGGRLLFTNKAAPGQGQLFRPGLMRRRSPSYRHDPLNLSAFRSLTARAARRYGLEHALLRAVIHAESSFNAAAVSPKGASGLMQLMPQTARSLGVRDRFSPQDNIAGGARYLAHLLRRYRRIDYALAAYNAGPAAVDRHRGVPPYAETRSYVRRVLGLKHRYRESLREA